ncbi:hypothetical protein COI61_27945 [Bacillus cereus]|nr:hypothetical protein COI61_27945 [Bacillus cereus]
MGHHSNSYRYHGDSENLLKYYNFIETPSMLTIPLTTSATETGLQVPLSLKHICPKDRVELIATIDWLTPLGGAPLVTARFPSTAEAVTTFATSINFLAEAPVIFSVYRDGIQIFTTMDYRTLLYEAIIPQTMTSTTDYTLIQVALRPFSTSTGTPPTSTTTFQCFDTGTSQDDHVYTITAQLGSSYRIVSQTTAIGTTSTTIPVIPVMFATTVSQPIAVVSSVKFSGKVIVELLTT